MIKKLPWAEMLVAGVVVAAGVGVYVHAHRDTGPLEASKDAGATVVAAITAYRADHGTYPERLEALVPRFLTEVPQPDWGLRRWSYERYVPADVTRDDAAGDDDVDYFRLSVAADESGYPVLYYDLAASRWVLNN